MYYFVEPMAEDDIPHVQAIESESFSTPWSANTYRREIRNTQSCRYSVARVSAAPPPARLAPHGARWAGLFSQLVGVIFPQTEVALPSETPVVGYGGLWLTVDEAHITAIAVDPRQRGKGIGELLLSTLVDHAYELGALQITLEVRVSNLVAQRLYVKYGFQPAGTRKRYYTDNGEDALIMWTDPINAPEYKTRLAELRRHLFARLRQQA